MAAIGKKRRQKPLRGRPSPTAHHPGFRGAVDAAYAEIAAGGRPRALTMALLSERRLRELGYDWFGENEPVLLTPESLSSAEHKKRYQRFSSAVWARSAKEIAEGGNWVVSAKQDNSRIFWWHEGKQGWVAVVKQAGDGGRELFLKTIYEEKERRIKLLQKRREAVRQAPGGPLPPHAARFPDTTGYEVTQALTRNPAPPRATPQPPKTTSR